MIFTHVFHNFENLAKQSIFQVKIVVAIGGTVGQADWIIDDTCFDRTMAKQTQSSSHMVRSMDVQARQ